MGANVLMYYMLYHMQSLGPGYTLRAALAEMCDDRVGPMESVASQTSNGSTHMAALAQRA